MRDRIIAFLDDALPFLSFFAVFWLFVRLISFVGDSTKSSPIFQYLRELLLPAGEANAMQILTVGSLASLSICMILSTWLHVCIFYRFARGDNYKGGFDLEVKGDSTPKSVASIFLGFLFTTFIGVPIVFGALFLFRFAFVAVISLVSWMFG